MKFTHFLVLVIVVVVCFGLMLDGAVWDIAEGDRYVVASWAFVATFATIACGTVAAILEGKRRR